MLLRPPKAVDLAGKSLLDLFSEDDRPRISEQVLSSATSASVVALNADMLDSDCNRVKVELFSAQFNNLANEKCFLLGLREIQDFECAQNVSECKRFPPGNEKRLVVMYDVLSLDIHLMSAEMERLCQPYWDEPPETSDEIVPITGGKSPHLTPKKTVPRNA